jgi:6-pyruvoyltetrahydropterin/6-carboxytetrahydropterin synthase
MVYDFGLMKRYIKELIQSFDHSIALWAGDNKEYIEDMKKHSARWVELPVSPSAEQFSRIIYLMVERVLESTDMVNGERDVKLHSIIVHETDTGYAQGFKEDAHSELMGTIKLKNIIFSKQIQDEWSDSRLWSKLLEKKILINPKMI